MKDSITPSKPEDIGTSEHIRLELAKLPKVGEVSSFGYCPACNDAGIRHCAHADSCGGNVIFEIRQAIATPSKEAKHTPKRYEISDTNNIVEYSGNEVRIVSLGELLKFVQEAEDLRKKLEFETLISDDHLAMKDEALAEIVSLRERIRELAEALTWSSDLFRLLMNNSVDFTDAEKMKISAIAVLSRNESKTPNEE